MAKTTQDFTNLATNEEQWEMLQECIGTPDILKGIKKIFGNVGVTVSKDSTGRPRLHFQHITPSNNVISVPDVAALLDTTVPAIRRLCGTRAQSRMRDPFPKGFLVGKELKWHIADVLGWIERQRIPTDTPTLKKGKIKK
ncbi:MAG: hypothetical protein WAN60_02845 [Candidatus Sulfotelmatobacter sp.]|jgi:hypothetical protein